MTNYLIEYEMYITTELGLSKNTCDNYLKDNEDYLKYLMKYRNVCDPKDISANDIRSYLVTLKRKNLTSSSISRKLSSIKSFHSFLVKFHYSNQNVAKTITNPKKEKKLPKGTKFLPESERLQRIEELNIEQKELEDELFALPITRLSQKMINRKAEIEKRLYEIETEQRRLSYKNVVVQC